MPTYRLVLRPLVAALIAVVAACQARAGEMTWIMPDFPPAGIIVNGKPSNGISDQVVKYIVSQWPQATHRYMYANPKRVWTMLAAGQNACLAGALRTPERERLVYFRNVNLLVPPEVIVRPESLPSVPVSAGKVDPAALMRAPGLRGVVIERRAYGGSIDTLLSRRETSANVAREAVGSYGRNIFQMLALGRADYTIDYDFTLAYEMQKNPALAKLKIVPLLDTEPFVVGAVACPRTAWGLTAIRKIDAILGTPEGAAVAAHAQYQWMTQSTLLRYREQMKDFFKKLDRADPAGFK